MMPVKTADGRKMYKARKWGEPPLNAFLDEDLKRFAADPFCINQAECKQILDARRMAKQQRIEAENTRREQKRALLDDDPFDPRTELSADAKYVAARIVKHLWILFVLLPLVLGILIAIVASNQPR